MDVKCIHDHESGGEADLYWLPEGCYCFDDQIQCLCDYHALKIWTGAYWPIYKFIYWGA